MKPVIAMAILAASCFGCLPIKSPADQEADAAAMAACVSAHWGEDWTRLVGDCAGQEFALFCDAVADVEWGVQQMQADAGFLAKQSTTVSYAAQAPIARRLAFKKQLH